MCKCEVTQDYHIHILRRLYLESANFQDVARETGLAVQQVIEVVQSHGPQPGYGPRPGIVPSYANYRNTRGELRSIFGKVKHLEGAE